MLNIRQFREHIVQPALDSINLYSQDAEELLVATCAIESLGGTYVKQIEGPALGIYQMEPRTYQDLWNTILLRDQKLRYNVLKRLERITIPAAESMITDLHYATVMARVFYLRIQDKLPDGKDIDALWSYYKSYWNTPKGATKKDPFIKAYSKFTGIKVSET